MKDVVDSAQEDKLGEEQNTWSAPQLHELDLNETQTGHYTGGEGVTAVNSQS